MQASKSLFPRCALTINDNSPRLCFAPRDVDFSCDLKVNLHSDQIFFLYPKPSTRFVTESNHQTYFCHLFCFNDVAEVCHSCGLLLWTEIHVFILSRVEFCVHFILNLESLSWKMSVSWVHTCTHGGKSFGYYA